MSELIATTSQTEGSVTTQPTKPLHPAEVDYLVRVIPVDNPLGMKALQHQRIYQVWKVLVDQNGQVVQVLGLMSSSIMDERYIFN